MLNPRRISWWNDAAGMRNPRRTSRGDDIAGIPGPRNNGGIMPQGSGFWVHTNKPPRVPGSSAPASKGYTAGLGPRDFTLGCRRLLEGNGPARPLKSASKWDERALAALFPRALGSSPAGMGISGFLPELLKAPWVPQGEVVLPSASRHKHPERWEPESISKHQPRGQKCQKTHPRKDPRAYGAIKPPLHPPSSVNSSTNEIKLYPSIQYSVHRNVSSPVFPRRQHNKPHGPRHSDGDFLGGKYADLLNKGYGMRNPK